MSEETAGAASAAKVRVPAELRERRSSAPREEVAERIAL
jgi:hypothetical protein